MDNHIEEGAMAAITKDIATGSIAGLAGVMALVDVAQVLRRSRPGRGASVRGGNWWSQFRLN